MCSEFSQVGTYFFTDPVTPVPSTQSATTAKQPVTTTRSVATAPSRTSSSHLVTPTVSQDRNQIYNSGGTVATTNSAYSHGKFHLRNVALSVIETSTVNCLN